MIPLKKVQAIQKDIQENEDDSFEDIAIRHDVKTEVVEAIEDGVNPNDIEEESNCRFCGVASETMFCSSDCRIAEFSEYT